MSSTSIFITVILFIPAIIVLSIVLPLVIIKRRNHLTGASGERSVSEMLSQIMRDGEFLINDYLASRNRDQTESIQIDHIFISYKGVFVIETKDYRGRIYGDRYQNGWTQVLAYGGEKHRLYNPIMQNETHRRYVKRIIGEHFHTYSAVIFINADISRIKNSSDILFGKRSFLNWYYSLPDCILDYSGIETVRMALTKEMSENPITKEQHISNIRRRHR